MFDESQGFVAMLVKAGSKIHVPICPYLISEVRRNCSTVRPHSNDTVALRKQVTKYKHMQKWMVELLEKCENGGIKIGSVNSIRMSKSINLLKFCTVF